MRIERLDLGTELSFRLIGRLEGLASRQLLRMLNGPAGDGGVVTIDLDELQTCDAAGADAFVLLTKRAREAGGDVFLTAPRARVMHDLDQAGALDKLQLTAPENAMPERDAKRRHALRYLTRVGEQQPFAYAPNRRDFYLVSDDTLWAHESHDWLLAADSGVALAHRSYGSYYDVESGETVFTETPTPPHTNVGVGLRDASGT